jgi:pilus assembly protein Flp/PilA
MKNVLRFLKDKSGATAIEYGLIAALIAVAIIGAVSTLGGNVSATFDTVSERMVQGEEGGGDAPADPPADD